MVRASADRFINLGLELGGKDPAYVRPDARLEDSVANADLSDSRLSAAVAIAPGFTESLTTESLQSLETPLLLIVAEYDQQLPPATHVKPVLSFLPQNSRYIEIGEAQHFSFLPKCRDGAIHVLSETNEEFVCQEFGRRSREYIHKQTLKVIEDFFKENDIL